MKIINIPVPTPFYVGDTNCYLIAEDPVTIIDVGPKTTDAYNALRDGLRHAGMTFADIRRIVLTHAHEDHCGLARRVRDEAKNAEIFIHGWETGHRHNSRLEHEEHHALLRRAGVSDDEMNFMRTLYDKVSEYADALADDEYVEIVDDEELIFNKGALRVVHTPGHTPGSCSFLREADRTIFAGDCILKRITPNPVLAPDPFDSSKRFASLAEYLVSLARLRSLAPTRVYGGHGQEIDDYEELFNRYVRAIDERQKAVIKALPTSGATAFQIACALFPDANDVHRFLAVSEAVAHLDYAEREGKIAVELKDGQEIYRKS